MSDTNNYKIMELINSDKWNLLMDIDPKQIISVNKNNLLQIDMTGDMGKNFIPIKQDLLNTGIVDNVALSDHITIYGGNNTGGLTWEGKTSSAQVLISQRYVSPGFFNTSGIRKLTI